MGSRFGGPKQLAPIGPGGSALIDYAARDAVAAGFGRLVLIVRRVEEFAIDGPPRTRSFELGRLSYDRDTRRVSIGPEGRSQFDLTVEALDVTLRIRPARPRP